MKIAILCLLIGLLAQESSAQTVVPPNKHVSDSVKNSYMTQAALKNPLLRQGIISTDVISPSDLQSYLYGNKLFDAKIKEVRTNAIFNVPIESWGRNSLTGTASIFQQHFNLMDIRPFQPGLNQRDQQEINKLTIGFTVSFLRVDSLFGKQVIYTGSITGLTGNATSIQKINYIAGVIFTLKQTRVTRMGLGAIMDIDPSVSIPVLPVFTYWHKFNNELELNVTLPQQAMLRNTISPKFWLNFGSSLGGSISFFKNNAPGIPQNGDYSAIDIKTGVGFEYRFNKYLIFGMNGGILSPLQDREFDQGGRFSEYFLRNKVNTAPYLNFSISALPFL